MKIYLSLTMVVALTQSYIKTVVARFGCIRAVHIGLKNLQSIELIIYRTINNQ